MSQAAQEILLPFQASDACDIKLNPEKFAEFINIVRSGKITRISGKQVFEKLLSGDDFDIMTFIKENQLEQVEDTGLVEETVRSVISANPKAVSQYKNGETKIMGFFVGQVMKKLKGKADPSVVNKAVAEGLDRTNSNRENVK